MFPDCIHNNKILPLHVFALFYIRFEIRKVDELFQLFSFFNPERKVYIYFFFTLRQTLDFSDPTHIFYIIKKKTRAFQYLCCHRNASRDSCEYVCIRITAINLIMYQFTLAKMCQLLQIKSTKNCVTEDN